MGAVAPLLQADEKRPVLEKKNMDLSIKPGDDFYRYANGQWIKGAVLPADRSQFNTFTEVRMQNQERLHNLFEALAQEALKAPKDSPVQKIGDFYATAMDTQSIEALGAKPLTGDMNKIGLSRTGPVSSDGWRTLPKRAPIPFLERVSRSISRIRRSTLSISTRAVSPSPRRSTIPARAKTPTRSVKSSSPM